MIPEQQASNVPSERLAGAADVALKRMDATVSRTGRQSRPRPWRNHTVGPEFAYSGKNVLVPLWCLARYNQNRPAGLAKVLGGALHRKWSVAMSSPTITLNSISHEVGRSQFRRLVLDDVSWAIRPRTRVVVLGPRNSGAAALLEIIAGLTLPTKGWVDRQAVVSMPAGGLWRYARHDTTRQLISRLSLVYSVDPKEVVDFVVGALERNDFMDIQTRLLPVALRHQISMILTYAFPCDFYLFSNASVGGGDQKFQIVCQRAFELRSRRAGIIMTTNSAKSARRLDTDMMGALVHQGQLTLYRKLSDAITVFESLPPEQHQPEEQLRADDPQPYYEEEVF